MITKQLVSNVDSITMDATDTTSNTTNITADASNSTDTHFPYTSPAGSFLVNEDVIDYEMQLALHEKWKNLTIQIIFFSKKQCVTNEFTHRE
ncbi:hypothetical protein [Veillonella magna]|uniref:hypothetical protein n=1 Tax=Veillonella magna TaxID=464322 RepID=UPI0023F081A6|nr:hypothetical protein [Veillonella magna]MBD8975643.1 hypothetical protein [Veillonella magna]